MTRDKEALERDIVPMAEVNWALRAVQHLDAPVRAVLAQRLGIGHTDAQALDLLDAPPDGIGPVELGAMLGIRSASATALVDRLESAGHVTRGRHPTDRRRIVVEPTDSARRAVVEVLRPLIEAMEGVAAEFTPEESAVVARYLRRVAEVTGEFVAGDAPPPCPPEPGRPHSAP